MPTEQRTAASSTTLDTRFSAPRHYGVVVRQRITELLRASANRARVICVWAPTGFGKSVAVADWARASATPVGWLSLNRYDSDPHQLLDGVVTALRKMASHSDDRELMELLRVEPQQLGIAATHRLLTEEFAARAGPMVLVVDDLHRAGSRLPDGILGALVEQGPPDLRLVLVGREPGQLPIGRHVLAGDAAVIGSETLRFTSEETAAAATGLGAPVSAAQAAELTEVTGGWAAAIRLALISGRELPGLENDDATASLLRAFVADEILAPLPDELSEFVLDATTVSDVDERLAVALSGRGDALALLEECYRRGLFLDRFGGESRASAYRWHSVFAAQCRAIVAGRNPDRARRLHLTAADALAENDPLQAIDEALAGDDPDRAARILSESWVLLLAAPHGDSLERACTALPEPWYSDPEILMIRANAMEMTGSRIEAQRLFQHVLSGLDLDSPELPERIARAVAFSQLSLKDSRDELIGALHRARSHIGAVSSMPGARLAAALLLLGRTQLLLRWNLPETIRTVAAAEERAIAADEPAIARRAAGLLAFTHAYRGDFERAQAILDRLRASTSEPDSWFNQLDASEAIAEAWMAYWRGDLGKARALLRHTLESRVEPTSFAAIAQQYLVIIAALDGDENERADAAELLRRVPPTEVRGVPWHTYRMVAMAKLAEADGNYERAAELVRRVGPVAEIPAAGMILAELARRYVGPRAATAVLRQFHNLTIPSYARGSMLVTAALVRRSSGDFRAAHELLEQALDLIAPLGITRPFLDSRPELQDLVAEHGTWSSRHAPFLARLTVPRATLRSLSPREAEILGYLRTTMTTAEIATDLGLSVNTVKTHLRLLYRKLGVRSRREAVRALS